MCKIFKNFLYFILIFLTKQYQSKSVATLIHKSVIESKMIRHSENLCGYFDSTSTSFDPNAVTRANDRE